MTWDQSSAVNYKVLRREHIHPPMYGWMSACLYACIKSTLWTMSKAKQKWHNVWRAEVLQFHFGSFCKDILECIFKEYTHHIIMWILGRRLCLYYFNITKWCWNSCCTTLGPDMPHKDITGHNTGQGSVSGFDLRMFLGCADTIRIPCVTSWLPETYHRMLEIRFQSVVECRWNQEGLVSI